MNADPFRTLTARAPLLQWQPPGLWMAGQQQAVSYPAGAHAAFHAVEEDSFWFRHRNRCLVSLVRRFGTGGLFLDIGGGRGIVSRALMAAGVDCALVEPDQGAALLAYGHGVTQVICARIQDLELPAHSLGDCGLFDVLEHIEDEAGTLARLHALIAPGRRLFISLPAYPALFSAEDVRAGHFRRHTVPSIRHALTTAGFEVVFTSYLFAPLPLPVFLLRTLPDLLGWGRRRSLAVEAEAAHLPSGLTARLVDHLLALEAKRFESGRPIPFGTSCLCVATRPLSSHRWQ